MIRFLLLCLLVGNVFADNLVFQIKGLPNNLKKELLSQLSISLEKKDKISEHKIAVLHDLTKQEIEDYLIAKGYYSHSIESKLEKNEQKWKSSYIVNIGNPVLIKKVTVNILGDGRNNPNIIKIQQVPKNLQIGKILEHDNYEQYKDAILITAFENGYLDSEFNVHEIRIDKENVSAEIYMELQTRNRYKFGKLFFINSVYNQKFLNKFNIYKPEEYYTTERLAELQRDLNRTGIFSEIKVSPEADRENKLVNININLKDKSSEIFTGSIGFSTNYKWRGKFGWQHNFKSMPGNQSAINLSQSKDEYNRRFTYSFLGSEPIKEKILFAIEESKTSQEAQFNKSFNSYVTQIYRYDNIKRLITVRYLNEIFKETSIDNKKHSKFILPSLQYVWTNEKKGEYFSHGNQIDFALRTGIGVIFSSTDILQAELNLKHVHLFDEKVRFIFKTQLGTTLASDFEKVPTSLKFFAGGDNNIRGYPYKSIGPTKFDNNLSRGLVVGGKNIITANIEAERHIVKNFSLASFFDIGAVSNDWPDEVYSSIGVGVRWTYPIGSFRLDLAKPLTQNVRGLRIHLSLTSDF